MSESKNLLELRSPDQPPLAATSSDYIERLCAAIEGLVEVNQALLAYMIDLDGGAPESTEGQSLDG